MQSNNCLPGLTTEQIASDWRQHGWRADVWTRASNQSGTIDPVPEGEAGGLYVQSECIPGRRAYMKPRCRDHAMRAAREKIASDLAYDLKICVPPVILADRDIEERFVAVSLVMNTAQYSWEEARRILEKGSTGKAAHLLAKPLSESAAKGLALDTWLGQMDHGDHPHNIIFGYERSNPAETARYVFLDYAFSMTRHRWFDGGFTVCEMSPFPALMLKALDPAILIQAIESIENFPDSTIDELVNRIPTSHLSDADKDMIRTGLVARKLLIRNALRALT